MSSKQREALSDACYAMFNFLKTQNGGYEEMANALDKAKAALAAPTRNCDVGTVEEQAERFHAFCESNKQCGDVYSCERCQLNSIEDCELAWAQMPYNEAKGEKSTNG